MTLNLTEDIMKFINKNTYLKMSLYDISKLDLSSILINDNMSPSQKITNCFNIIKKICNEKIPISKEENANYFHLYFNDKTDMIYYSLFCHYFIKEINEKLSKDCFNLMVDAGSSEFMQYTIRFEINDYK